MSPAPASFELERFSVTPVTDDTVLLELQGLLVDVPPRSASPRLLVEGARRSRHEHDALETELDGDRLRASFIVPAADAETAGFALAVGGLLLELPAPDSSPGADRAVSLARELNVARRQLTRFRAQLQEHAEAARDHADELIRTREEAAAQAQETVQVADERAAEAEQVSGERVAASEARVAEVEQAASARESELEAACAQLEGVLADVRASAEERDATAAEDQRQLEAQLTAALAEREAAGADAGRATARVSELEREAAQNRSELELARRALEARDAELARSPDRRARAVARPRTAAALADEQPADSGEPDAAAPSAGADDTPPASPNASRGSVDAPPRSPDASEGADDTLPGSPDASKGSVDASSAVPDGLEESADAAFPDDPDATIAFVPGEEPTGASAAAPLADEEDAGGSGPEADDQATAPFAADAGAPAPEEDPGDPVPDDGEPEVTADHDTVPVRRPDPEPPEDTGPIPLRRGSERRYVPRGERDEEMGGDAIRVLGRDRPRASALPPPPEAEPGPPLPFGLTQRVLVLAVLAFAAFLVLVAILGYVF